MNTLEVRTRVWDYFDGPGQLAATWRDALRERIEALSPRERSALEHEVFSHSDDDGILERILTGEHPITTYAFQT